LQNYINRKYFKKTLDAWIRHDLHTLDLKAKTELTQDKIESGSAEEGAGVGCDLQ